MRRHAQKFGSENNRVGGMNWSGAVQMINQVAGRYFAHFVAGIIDGGEIWFHYSRDRVILNATKAISCRMRMPACFNATMQPTAQLSLAANIASDKGFMFLIITAASAPASWLRLLMITYSSLKAILFSVNACLHTSKRSTYTFRLGRAVRCTIRRQPCPTRWLVAL